MQGAGPAPLLQVGAGPHQDPDPVLHGEGQLGGDDEVPLRQGDVVEAVVEEAGGHVQQDGDGPALLLQQGGAGPQQEEAPVLLQVEEGGGDGGDNLEQIGGQPVQQVPAHQPADVQPPLLAQQGRIILGVVGGEQEDLAPWLDPVVPAGRVPGLPDATGWNLIDRLGGWECGLTGFYAMEQVPAVHRVKFAKAYSLVLQNILEANIEENLTRALKWFLILPQALLRQSKRGGKKGQGAAWVSAKFQAIVNEDWGSLLHMLESDKEANRKREEERRRRRRRNPGQGQDRDRQRETVLNLVAKGQVGRAARRISSHGVASVDCAATMAALKAKYPTRSYPMPASVSKGQVVDNLAGLKDSLLSLEKGVSPGTGGCRPEYLTTLAEMWDEPDMNRLEEFGLSYLNGHLPAWFYRVWGTVTTVPLFKTSQREADKLRPVGVKNPLIRTINRQAARQNRPALQSHLEPQQLALSPAGGHKLVHMVRMCDSGEEPRLGVC